MESQYICLLSLCLTLPCMAQETVLSDNFDDGVLASHWSFDSRPFETGTIDIGGGIIDGAMRLEVTALSDFWGGFALRTERTFAASEANPLSLQVTRVVDEGVGITRSGAWIMNSDRSQYVFVSQNIGEGGWQYNRRIGQEGDNPTGSGINIDAFDALDEDFDSHDIRFVANGTTVGIYLDDQLGAEVDFPLVEGIVFAFGVYVRSVEDDGVASFDNVEVKSDLPTGLPCVTLSAQSTALFAGEGGEATVSVPTLYVSDNAAAVTITSSDPEVATLEGANAAGELTVNFSAGGQSSVPIKILAGKGGSATFELSTSDPLCAGGGLNVSVSSAFIRNPSFEESEIGEWPGYGEIAEWVGGSGVNNGDDITPFGDNGAYPDGQLIAFSQGGRDLSQDIAGLDPSKLYQVSFRYNARQCCGGTIGLSVFFDDQQIGETLENIQPVGNVEPYHTYSGAFQPATSSGSFIMTTAAEGDATLVFDAVSIVERSIDDLVLVNPSFEASGRVPDPGYLASISGWDGVGQFGVNVGGSGPIANNGTTPDQDLVAFIQGEGSSLSQTLNAFLVGETYTLEYAVNARDGNAPGFKVALDGAVLSEESISPVGGTGDFLTKTVVFTATDVTHTVTFEQTAAGDQTVLLDDVRILGEASNIPCVPVRPEKFAAGVGQTGDAVTISMPEEAVADGPVTVTVSNNNPNAFVLSGADVNGSVSLEFTADGELTQSAAYEAVGKGKSIFALTPSKVLCLERSSVTATALAGVVRNPGFESNYPEAWPHYGPIDEWSGVGGNSGTNLADGPFHDNGFIPDGRQIGFGQGPREMTQEIGGLEVGANYWLQFHYNVRNCCGGTMGLAASFGNQELFNEDLVEVVGPEEPYHFASIAFTPDTAGGTLKFVGTAEGDATYLLDGITIVKRAENEALVINPSFEATSAVTLPAPGYLGTVDAPVEELFRIGGWEAAGNYGVNSSGDGPFADNGVNPDQDDVVFLQGAGSSIRQTIQGLAVGETYTLTYAYNARGGDTPSLQVDIGGNLAQQTFVSPVGGEQPYHQHSFSFKAADTSADLSFTQTAAGDQIVLIDDVHVFLGGEALPCVNVSPGLIIVDEGTNGEITVRVPDDAFGNVNEITVTFASDAAAVADLAPRTLTFTEDGERSQVVAANTGGIGSATISISVSEGACLSRESLSVMVNEIIVPRNFVANGSFESDSLPPAPGYGPMGDWIKDGGGGQGLNDAKGPFHNNGLIPDRNQVALMQNTLSLSQELHGLEAGAQYWLQFHYNIREGFDLPNLSARIDGQDVVVLEAIDAVGVDQPYHFISVPFIPSGTTATLQFASFVAEGGDGTVLLDAVTVTRREPGEVVVVNPSFEASGVAEAPGYLQPATVAGWVIEGDYGTNVSGVGEGPFADNGTNPDQNLVLFLQGAANAGQSIHGLTAGQTYTLKFAYNARGGNSPQLVIVIDDVAVFDEIVSPVGGDAPYHQGEAMFTASGETATIFFGQVAEGDHTILLDDIHVLTGMPGEPTAWPILSINAVEVSWPNVFTDLTLEESDDLRSWTVSAGAVTDRDGRFVVPVSSEQDTHFYRLKR
jgi:hypothetical protein